MKKSIFKKLGGLFLGLAMGLGVAVGATAGNKASEVKAADVEITNFNEVFGMSQDGSASVSQNTVFSGTSGNVTFTANSGNSTNSYLKDGDFRLYNGYTLTIGAPSGKTIIQIDATKSGKTISGITADVGSLTVASGGGSMTWTGNSSSVVFSISTTMGFGSFAVTLSSGGTPTTNYTVTFDANGHGTAPSAVTVSSGGKVIKPTNPTAEGYTFGGWYQEAGCTNEYNFDTAVTSSFTLYAKWTQNGGGGSSKTYQFITANGITFGTKTSDSKALNTVNWKISTATNLGSYNSGNYAGQQLGTSSNAGAIELETVNNWGEQSGTTWSGYKKVKKVYLWLNNGSGTVGTYDVKVDGTSCSKSGTVTKNSTAGSDYTKTSKVTYTPQSGHDMGKVKINVTSSSKAIYFCAIEIECEEVAVAKYSVTNNSGDTVTFTGATGANAAQNDTDYTATIAAASGYNQVSISSIVVGSTTLTSSDYTFNGGLLTIPKAKINGDITITAVGSKASYTVSASGTGVTFASKSNAAYMTEYKISFTVNEGYDAPSSVTVTAGGTSVSATLSGTEITVPAASVTGNLVITANATLKTYSLTTSGLQNIEFAQEEGSSLKHGGTFGGTLSANTGFTLEGATIVVTMGGVDVTSEALADDYIQIDEVTGDIVITGSGVEVQDAVINIDNDEFSIEENDTDTLTVEYSRATLVSASASLSTGDDVVIFGALDTSTGEISLTPKARGEGYYELTVYFINNSSANDSEVFDVYVVVYGDELTGISLSSESDDYYLGDDLSLPTVTAHYSLSEDQTVTASWNDNVYNKYQTGSYVLTATYEGKTATYTANVAAKSYTAKTEDTHVYSYDKVTSSQTDWRGMYLIVYETGNLAMDGSLATLDAVSNSKAVTISSNSIATDKDGLINNDAIYFTVDYKGTSTSVYSLKSASGKYISGTTTSAKAANGIKQADNPDDYEITFSGTELQSKSSDQQMAMKYNKGNDQTRFRFYKSGQDAVALYKFTDHVTPGEDIPSDEKHPIRITEASCTATSKLIGNSLGVNDFTLSVQYDTGNDIVNNIKPTSVQRKTSENTYSDDCTLEAGTNTYKLTYLVTYAEQAYSVSKEIDVDAAAKTLTGISLTYGDNFKDAFGLSETFTHEDVIVTANYANGYSSEVVTSGISFSSPDMTTAGEKTITVTYQEMTATYKINVSAAKSVELVKVETSNTGATGTVVDELTGSFNGYVGNTVDVQLELKNFTNAVSFDEKQAVTGLTLSSASYSNGVWNGTITVSGVLTNQEYVIVVSEGATSVEVKLTFNAIQDYIDDVEVSGAKTEYTVGESFDSSMTVTAVYKSSIRDVLETSEYTVTGIPSIMKRGTYTITVTVNGTEVSDSFIINVVKPSGLVIITATSEMVPDPENPVTNPESRTVTPAWDKLGKSDRVAKNSILKVENIGHDLTSITVSFEGKALSSNKGSLFNFMLEAYSGETVVDKYTVYYTTTNEDGTDYYVTTDSYEEISLSITGISESDHIDGFVFTACDKLNGATGSANGNLDHQNELATYTYNVSVPGEKEELKYHENPISDELYDFILKANEIYADVCGTDENNKKPDSSKWLSICDTAEYKALSGDDKNLLKTGLCGNGYYESNGRYASGDTNSWNEAIKFLEKYDRVVSNYGTDSDYNYLGRDVSSSNPRINPILALSNVDNSVWVISAVALVGLVAVGGYFFYRKRKEI